jgi:hypothetical protein
MRQKGFSPIIIAIIFGLLALGVGGYFFVQMTGLSLPGRTPEVAQPTEMSEEVSDSADSDSLDKEIEETQLDSYDEDFSELDSSASQL